MVLPVRAVSEEVKNSKKEGYLRSKEGRKKREERSPKILDLWIWFGFDVGVAFINNDKP